MTLNNSDYSDETPDFNTLVGNTSSEDFTKEETEVEDNTAVTSDKEVTVKESTMMALLDRVKELTEKVNGLTKKRPVGRPRIHPEVEKKPKMTKDEAKALVKAKSAERTALLKSKITATPEEFALAKRLAYKFANAGDSRPKPAVFKQRYDSAMVNLVGHPFYGTPEDQLIAITSEDLEAFRKAS